MATPPRASHSGYRFEGIIVDVERRRVIRDGTPIRLGKLTYELLIALAESAPGVVTREELVKRVWGGRVVSPETIKQRIKLLRQALSDDVLLRFLQGAVGLLNVIARSAHLFEPRARQAGQRGLDVEFYIRFIHLACLADFQQ